MFSRTHRLKHVPGVLALAAGLAAPTALPAHAADPGPINAGNTYKWGAMARRYEFEGGMHSHWKVRGSGTLQDRYGMLSLNSAEHGDASATLRAPAHRYGRWEVRVRTRAWDTRYANYRVRTQLVPAGPSHCGARDISLGAYRNLGDTARLYARDGHTAFAASDRLRIRDQHFHTLAVEVTPQHVAWFLDAHVVRVERSPAASTGVPLTIKVSLQAQGHQRMDRTMLQYDWMRYWTLSAPDAKPLTAPAAHRTSYRPAC